MRRVVITGMGTVSPLGLDTPSTWSAALAGESGIDFIQSFDASEFPVRIAAEVKGFEPPDVVSPKEARRLDRNVLLAVEAGRQALDDAGLDSHYRPSRVGIAFGSAIGGFLGIMEQHEVLQERGPTRVSPHFLPSVLVDSASGQLAISLGLKGPNYAPVSACDRLPRGRRGSRDHPARRRRRDARRRDRGVHAPADPRRLLCHARPRRRGGASAARVAPVRRDTGRVRDRRGAGALVLEELEAAQARGATIYAEVLAYGTSNDGYHLAAPEPEAIGVAEMMRAAIERAGVEPERVGYINAHGTSTPLGDAAETKAIKDVFGDHAYELAVSSTKSMMGHCFGAAGAIEAQMAALAVHHGKLPPTINYEHPDPACDLDYVPNEARDADVEVALSNAMGLGGHNACVLVGRVE